MVQNKQSIVVVGTGYWGKNLVRCFHQLGVLHGICDSDPAVLQRFLTEYQLKHSYAKFTEILKDNAVKAVALATPAVTHYEMVKATLLAGKDIFVEKPLALKVEEAEELADLADKNGRIIMVDHILQFHPAVIKLKNMIDQGVLGKLLYIYSNRLNIGLLRTEENILWSFAPHDISVILYFVGKSPIEVRAFGEAYLQDHIYDTTITDLKFVGRLKAHIFVSWLHPFKEQKLVVIGNAAMAVFNDMEKEEKLTLYPHKIEWIKQMPVASKAERQVIPVEAKEPLKEACLHFLHCLETRTTPKTDAQEAISVLRVLQLSQQHLDLEHHAKI